MGRGLGTTQRRILDALAQWNGAMTVPELAVVLERSQPQIRTAIHALEKRELVYTTKGYIDWKGEGEYGPRSYEYEGTGEYTDWGSEYQQRSDRVRKYHGIPVYGMKVWLPDMYQEAVQHQLDIFHRMSRRQRRKYTHQDFERGVHRYFHRTPEQEAEFQALVDRMLGLMD